MAGILALQAIFSILKKHFQLRSGLNGRLNDWREHQDTYPGEFDHGSINQRPHF
jgi:hypothetical protein